MSTATDDAGAERASNFMDRRIATTAIQNFLDDVASYDYVHLAYRFRDMMSSESVMLAVDRAVSRTLHGTTSSPPIIANALAVECPVCNAAVCKPCITADSSPHALRQTQAARNGFKV